MVGTVHTIHLKQGHGNKEVLSCLELVRVPVEYTVPHGDIVMPLDKLLKASS